MNIKIDDTNSGLGGKESLKNEVTSKNKKTKLKNKKILGVVNLIRELIILIHKIINMLVSYFILLEVMK